MSTNVNLGRIKGAGFFTSTASSSTSVAISTIAPTNITPLVGDSIVFPNGDVRRVTAKSSTTITCGDVVANIKGAKGDNGGGSNPNLLINSNFAINQRDGYFAPVGATVYADDLTTVLGTVRTAIQTNIYNATWRVATSIEATLNGSNITISTGYIKTSDCTRGYVKVGYTVDRWTLDNNSILLPTSDGIALTSACRQFIENKEQLWGKTLTLSFKTASGITSKSGTLPSTAPSSNTTFISVPTDSSGVNAIVRYVNGLLAVVINSNLGATINWVKLEVGDVATEYTPPLIAEELPKCQRYYQRFNSGGTYHAFALGWVRTNTASQNLRFVLYLPQRLRVKPTFAYSGKFGCSSVGSTLPITDITLDGSSSIDAITLLASSSQTTQGQGCGLVSNNDSTAYIELNAEL